MYQIGVEDVTTMAPAPAEAALVMRASYPYPLSRSPIAPPGRVHEPPEIDWGGACAGAGAWAGACSDPLLPWEPLPREPLLLRELLPREALLRELLPREALPRELLPREALLLVPLPRAPWLVPLAAPLVPEPEPLDEAPEELELAAGACPNAANSTAQHAVAADPMDRVSFLTRRSPSSRAATAYLTSSRRMSAPFPFSAPSHVRLCWPGRRSSTGTSRDRPPAPAAPGLCRAVPGQAAFHARSVIKLVPSLPARMLRDDPLRLQI
jgi:hypothetical protein